MHASSQAPFQGNSKTAPVIRFKVFQQLSGQTSAPSAFTRAHKCMRIISCCLERSRQQADTRIIKNYTKHTWYSGHFSTPQKTFPNSTDGKYHDITKPTFKCSFQKASPRVSASFCCCCCWACGALQPLEDGFSRAAVKAARRRVNNAAFAGDRLAAPPSGRPNPPPGAGQEPLEVACVGNASPARAATTSGDLRVAHGEVRGGTGRSGEEKERRRSGLSWYRLSGAVFSRIRYPL